MLQQFQRATAHQRMMTLNDSTTATATATLNAGAWPRLLCSAPPPNTSLVGRVALRPPLQRLPLTHPLTHFPLCGSGPSPLSPPENWSKTGPFLDRKGWGVFQE